MALHPERINHQWEVVGGESGELETLRFVWIIS